MGVCSFICGCYVFSVYKVTDTAKETKDKIADVGANATNNNYESDRTFEEDGTGTEIGRKDDPLTEYREKEPIVAKNGLDKYC